MEAKKGMWVEIENTVLTPEERAPHLPEDTKRVPLKMWVRGFLINEQAKIGDEVMIKTLTDRVVKGTLVEVNPRHIHDFGNCVEELLISGYNVKKELLEVVKGAGDNE